MTLPPPADVSADSSLEARIAPILNDNYLYLLRDSESGETAVVDPGDADAAEAALAALDWTPSWVLLTHHHGDHIAGAETLAQKTGAKIAGAAADAGRLPRLDAALTPGEPWRFGAQDVAIIDVSGHTVGHIAYHFPKGRMLLAGDALFALGCGRRFEGTPEQMWAGLARLAELPPHTAVCAGHEYTLANGAFALTIEPNNAALKARVEDAKARRADGRPTLPTTIAAELEANPFLRAAEPTVRAAVGMPTAAPAEVFAELRRRKDAA